jgi:MYXO-CTERM domain-containing protein
MASTWMQTGLWLAAAAILILFLGRRRKRRVAR